MKKENEMTWTAEKIKQLKKLWQKGKSTVEIGRELGISKNAVVGKVHRLELTARPSPIKKEATTVAKIQKPKVVKTDKMSLLDLKLNSCRWPIGEPKDPDFHFCGKDTVTGKPYCVEHCKIAYTSLKELANQKAEAKKNATEEEEEIKPKKSKKEENAKTKTLKEEPQKSTKKITTAKKETKPSKVPNKTKAKKK